MKETKETMNLNGIPVYAFHTLLTASVTPTSFVSNSYNPTAVERVKIRRSQLQSARDLGTRCWGK